MLNVIKIAARGRGRPPSKLNNSLENTICFSKYNLCKVENANYNTKESNLRKRSLIDTQL
jgi:hypothetical protein